MHKILLALFCVSTKFIAYKCRCSVSFILFLTFFSETKDLARDCLMWLLINKSNPQGVSSHLIIKICYFFRYNDDILGYDTDTITSWIVICCFSTSCCKCLYNCNHIYGLDVLGYVTDVSIIVFWLAGLFIYLYESDQGCSTTILTRHNLNWSINIHFIDKIVY